MRTRQSDIEREVEVYQDRMTPLARELSRTTSRAMRSFARDVEALMERTGYRESASHAILNLPADASTIHRLEALCRLCPDRYRQRIWQAIAEQVGTSRLTNRRAIKTLARLNAYAVLDDLRMSAARILGGVVRDGYLRATFTLQKEVGEGWATDALRGGRVQTIVDTIIPMDMARKYVDPMVDMSSKVVISSMLQGLPPDTVSKSVDDIDKSMMFRSKRMARTAITDAAQDAHTESYKRHDVKMYVFMATWDERTCPVCGQLDGQAFPVDEAQRGVNYPPMHPNCRCTTVAKIDPELEALMRQEYYTDDATGIRHAIPRSFGYKEWYNMFGPGRTDGVAYKPKFKD